MAELTPETFNHFALLRFTPDFWRRQPGERHKDLECWLERLRHCGEAMHLYQLFGVETGHDLMVWSAVPGGQPSVAAEFFRGFAEAIQPARSQVEVRTALWGFTRPSTYTKARSSQEMDPFATARSPYLVMYPFTKTSGWYQLPREERQAMMMEHIKLGKQYHDITQLLLYSTGLQDQEFVVVYETEDLIRFSALVSDLRCTAGRPYTERDTPLHTAVYQKDPGELRAWL
jgi:chlorite dismutase